MTELQIDTLGYYLDRALNVMVKRLNRLFVEHGIDLQHSKYTVLKVLWCEDGLSQSQLSKILAKDPAAISRALNYLEQKGYIKRTSINRKTNGVFLTEYANSRKDEIEHLSMRTDEVENIASSVCLMCLLVHSSDRIYLVSRFRGRGLWRCAPLSQNVVSQVHRHGLR